MGVNISGKGVLSGLATLVAGAVNNFNLLVTRIIGYTSIPSTGGSSYYTTMVGSSGPGFVALSSNNLVAYSTDGINWISTNIISKNWSGLTYGNGKFVAISEDVAAYSTDGINWTTTTLPLTTSWGPVTYGNDKFVVIAINSNSLAYSTDGINWTQGTMILSLYWTSLTFGNGKFIAVADGSDVAGYSTDGINWSQVAMPSQNSWKIVTYGNGKFLAKTQGEALAISENGINWSEVTSPNAQSITYGDGKFVTIQSGSNLGAYSTDGINWTTTTLPQSYNWKLVQYVNGKFVAITSGDLAAYSTDGINWTATSIPYAIWYFVTAGTISTLVETQVSIGNQGEEGSEILAPIDVYTVPVLKTTDIQQVTVKNNSANTITYDLAVLNSGIELTEQNALINDQAVLAGATATVTSISNDMTAGQRIVVLPSAVDVVEVKVYGIES